MKYRSLIVIIFSVLFYSLSARSEEISEHKKQCTEAPVCAPPSPGEDYTNACQLPLVTESEALKSKFADQMRSVAKDIIEHSSKRCAGKSKESSKNSSSQWEDCMDSGNIAQGITTLMTQSEFYDLDVTDVYKIWAAAFFIKRNINKELDEVNYEQNHTDQYIIPLYVNILQDTTSQLDIKDFVQCNEENPTIRGFIYSPWSERNSFPK